MVQWLQPHPQVHVWCTQSKDHLPVKVQVTTQKSFQSGRNIYLCFHMRVLLYHKHTLLPESMHANRVIRPSFNLLYREAQLTFNQFFSVFKMLNT